MGTTFLPFTDIRELGDKEYRACYRLNFGTKGEMRWLLAEARQGSRSGSVVRIIDTETGRLLAWALVADLGDDMGEEAHYYVRCSHRRRGLGRQLRTAVLERYPSHKVWPWDPRSDSFFLSTSTELHPV